MGGSSQEKVVRTACSLHCGGKCLLKVHLKDGVVVRIETDDSKDPAFRACLRCHAYRGLLYHPDRLKYPLRRTGERGEGKFERISWDVALDTIASQLKRVREEHGPGAVLLVPSGGNLGELHRSTLMSSLLNLTGGHTATWGYFSYEGGTFASLASYANLFTGSSRDDLLNSRLIILWGINSASTIQQTGSNWFLVKAKEAGIKIISVDPRLTNTVATFADQWIPIRPSTDAAMLISMAYVIIKEGLEDQAYLDRHTVGFEQYKRYVMGDEDGIPKSPAWAEPITGVPASTIENLAKEYATTKPAALLDGIAPGRTVNGEQYHRAAIALAAMTGNIGVHGGHSPGRGPYSMSLASYPFKLARGVPVAPNPHEQGAPPRDYSLPSYEKFMPGVNSSARLNRSATIDAMLRGKAGGYPNDYKFLYTVCCNYVNQMPNTNKIVRALKNMEFIVTHEQFMTPTAKFADIVLPVCTYMECNDIWTGGAVPAYGYMKKVIEPLGESKSQLEICAELAKRMGVTNFTDKTEEEWLRQMVEGGDGIPDYETFRTEAIHKVPLDEPYVPFKEQIEDPDNNPFPTPSGKIEIHSQLLADMNHPEIPPIPKYIEPREGLTDPLKEKYPLQLITTHFIRRALSVFDNVPWLKELEPQAVTMNTNDAQERGITDGDMVKVFNDRGALVLPARVTERIMPGVVEIPQGAWYDPDEDGVDRGGNPNVLTNDFHSPAGTFTTNTALVEMAKT